MKKLFKLYVIVLCLLFINPLNASKCEDYYFGLGVDQDYKKALKCAERQAEPDIILIVLMYLNGEGTPKDPKKALEAIEKQNQIDPHNKNNVTMQTLKTKVMERINNPGTEYAKLDYGEVAMTTYDMSRHAYIVNKLEEQETKKEIAVITKKLGWRQAGILAEIQKQFEIIKKNDGKRASFNYMGGTIRSSAGLWTEEYLIDRHLKRIRMFLKERSLEKSAENEFVEADRELNTNYKEMLAAGDKMGEELKENEESYYEDYIREYKPAGVAAQKAWIIYRDKWVELIKSTKLKDMDDEKTIEISVKTLLTRERAEEVLFDPIGN